MKKLLPLFLAVFPLMGFAQDVDAAVGITGCTVIDRSGSYVLVTNIKAAATDLKNPGPAVQHAF